MKGVRALIFDVDGTLAETERDGHRLAFNRAFVAAGLDWVWSVELYGQLLEIAGGKERIAHYMQHYQPNFVPEIDRTEFIAGLHQSKSRFYQQLLQGGEIKLRPGVRRLIQEARESGVRLAIATTSSLENVIPLLETALEPDSPSWFDVIAAGDIVPRKKPAPDIYQYVLETLALAPEDCLVLEDSQQGLRAAVAAGLQTIVTCNDYTRDHDLTSAQLVVDCLGDVDNPFQVLQGDLPKKSPNAKFFDLALANSFVNASDNSLESPLETTLAA